MGIPLYLSTSGGVITETAPTGSGEIVRIIGYTFWNTSNQSNSLFVIRFDPDNTWIEL